MTIMIKVNYTNFNQLRSRSYYFVNSGIKHIQLCAYAFFRIEVPFCPHVVYYKYIVRVHAYVLFLVDDVVAIMRLKLCER